jgi:hypothetical protein
MIESQRDNQMARGGYLHLRYQLEGRLSVRCSIVLAIPGGF